MKKLKKYQIVITLTEKKLLTLEYDFVMEKYYTICMEIVKCIGAHICFAYSFENCVFWLFENDYHSDYTANVSLHHKLIVNFFV